MDKNNLEWEAFKMDLGKTRACERSYIRSFFAILVIAVVGFVVLRAAEERTQSVDITLAGAKILSVETTTKAGSEEFTIPYVKLQIPKKDLAILLPVIISVIFSRLVYLYALYNVYRFRVNSELNSIVGEMWDKSGAGRFLIGTLLLRESSFWPLFFDAIVQRIGWVAESADGGAELRAGRIRRIRRSSIVFFQQVLLFLLRFLVPVAALIYFICRMYALNKALASSLVLLGSTAILSFGITGYLSVSPRGRILEVKAAYPDPDFPDADFDEYAREEVS